MFQKSNAKAFKKIFKSSLTAPDVYMMPDSPDVEEDEKAEATAKENQRVHGGQDAGPSVRACSS